jgi:hypothetical protein
MMGFGFLNSDGTKIKGVNFKIFEFVFFGHDGLVGSLRLHGLNCFNSHTINAVRMVYTDDSRFKCAHVNLQSTLASKIIHSSFEKDIHSPPTMQL